MPHPKVYGDMKRPSNLIPGHNKKSYVQAAHQHPPICTAKEIHLYFSNISKASNQYQLLPQWINGVWRAPDQEELTPFDISNNTEFSQGSSSRSDPLAPILEKIESSTIT